MSCRDTKGGTVATRIARAYSDLPDQKIRSIFHQLRREGAHRPHPTENEMGMWKDRMRALIDNARMSQSAIEASHRDVLIAVTENPDPATFHAWANIERVARQRAVILELKGNVADLAPPGSQTSSYTWDPDGRPARVWYASYGSNMDRARFLTYVEGGSPAGSARVHAGCRDTTLPAGDIPIRYRGRVHFAYNSRHWGGGVAFLDHDGASLALGRAYNVSMSQFDDIVAQENGRMPGSGKAPTDEVLINGSARMSSSVYGTLEHIGDYQGAPVLTFTGDFSAQESLDDSFRTIPGFYATTPPAPNYLRMLGSGLSETLGMTERQQADYLRGFPGMEQMGRREVLRILRTPPEPPRRPVNVFQGRLPTRSGSQPSWSGLGASKSARTWDYDTPAEVTKTERTDEEMEELWRQAIAEMEADEASGDTTLPASASTGYGKRVKGCLWCDQPGHKMNDCPQLPSNQKSADEATRR